MSCVRLFLLLLGFLVGCCQGLAAVNSSLAVDSYDLVANPCQDVRLAGFICVDCSTLGFCSNVEGQWQTLSMTSCQTERGFYCSDEGTYGCTWQPRCSVPVRGKFFCQSPGIFPDPYDCRSYHVCSEQNVDTPHQCTNGAAYSLLTNSCTLSRESKQCTEKQYSCNYVGETGAWASDNRYYYVCQKDTQGGQDVFYPLMMKCSNGSTFNNHSCVKNTTQLRSAKLAEPRLKLSPCQHGYVYPADTTSGYYYCSSGRMLYQNCPEGYSFDAAVSTCIMVPKNCQNGMIYPAETDAGFYYCYDDKQVYQKCAEGYTFDLEHKLCMKQRVTCVDYELYEAETNRGYYFCNNGELIYYECPYNSYFNSKKSICVHRYFSNVIF